VDAQDLEPLVGHADVDLAVKAPEAPQGRVDGVGPVGRRYHDDVGAALQAVHQREQLADDAALHLSLEVREAGGQTTGREGARIKDEGCLHGWLAGWVDTSMD